MIGAEVDGGEVQVGGEPLDDDRTYRVTGSDLEFSVYGTLLERTPPEDLDIRVPAILPELLESYLAHPAPVGDPARQAGGSTHRGPGSELLLELPEPGDRPEAHRLVDGDHVVVHLGVVGEHQRTGRTRCSCSRRRLCTLVARPSRWPRCAGRTRVPHW